MDSLKDFKSLANEIMHDISVSDELKQKTLEKCKTKTHIFSNFKAVPALCACLLILFIGLYNSSLFKPALRTEVAANKKMAAKTFGTLMNGASTDIAPQASPSPEVGTARIAVHDSLVADKVTATETGKTAKAAPKAVAVAPKTTKAAPKTTPVASKDNKASKSKEVAVAFKTPVSTPGQNDGGTTANNSKAATLTTLTADPKGKQANDTKTPESTGAAPAETVKINTMDEAKKYLDGAVLTPAYLPDGFTLQDIKAEGTDSQNITSIMLNYASLDRQIAISFEKGMQAYDFTGYNNIVINGMPGHIKSIKDGNVESTDLRWFAGDVLYSVKGSISEEEAVKIGENLK